MRRRRLIIYGQRLEIGSRAVSLCLAGALNMQTNTISLCVFCLAIPQTHQGVNRTKVVVADVAVLV
jgi:hypothetical protein